LREFHDRIGSDRIGQVLRESHDKAIAATNLSQAVSLFVPAIVILLKQNSASDPQCRSVARYSPATRFDLPTAVGRQTAWFP
jgi:hypothetical protein